ncbi:MAG: DUF2066 domain-containing protein [Steroidobacteraceae bacterium]|nr:DUF2066 domain-containing protein [Steroidobacteraceae bacterium]
MQRQSRTVIKGGTALRALACCILLTQPCAAGAEVSIYQAVVPLAGTTAADRDAGFGDALRSSAVRASGQRDAGSNPVVATAAADPSRFVRQYSTSADRMLKVGFDAQAMDGLLQRARLPFWPVERPVTVVLLVVPSVAGGQRAVLASDRVPERAEVERTALARGLPITWPQSMVDAQQVRAMLAAGQGTAVPGEWGGKALLAGAGTGGSVAWVFTEGGRSVRRDGGLQDGIDLAADSLAARYAPASSRGVATIAIRVGGIEDVRAYARLVDYLESLSLVRSVGVSGLEGKVVSLDITLRGDLEQLRRIAALDTHLVPAAAAEDGGARPPDFDYVP